MGVCEVQTEHGKFHMSEHVAGATSWHLIIFKRAKGKTTAQISNSDCCTIGLHKRGYPAGTRPGS